MSDRCASLPGSDLHQDCTTIIGLGGGTDGSLEASQDSPWVRGGTHGRADLLHDRIVDGYVEDESGKFRWAVPDDEVHSFVNDLVRPVVTYFYGRRMYETMLAWQTITDGPPPIQDFGSIWRQAEKVVFSRTLTSPSSARTRIEREFRPDVVRTNGVERAG